MANPMYGQNKADNDVDIYGRGKVEVITHSAGTTRLMAEQSGAIVFVNDADGVVTLPSAEAGLTFKILVGIDSTGVKITAASGDCFFGQIHAISTTDNKCATQDIDYATAIATVADYDTIDTDQDGTTLGGSSGNVIELTAIDGTAWLVETVLSVVGNPSSLAVINAS
tara:strand:- start:5703 stop:6206 length:504 start_codon:yes stop_codon:yes gene_type:complete